MSLKNFHPLTILVYFISVIGFTVASLNPFMLIISFAGGLVCFAIMSGKTDVWIYVPMFILIAVTNPIFSHNGQTVLFFLKGQRVTLEAFVYGVAAALLVISALYWCKFFSFVFSTDKLTWIAGVLSPKLSVLITMSLRFVPLIKENAAHIYNAQLSMGIFKTEKLFGKLKLMAAVFSALVSMSMENAVETADTMRSRGFGKGKRTSYTLFKFTCRDFFIISYILVTDVLIITLFKYIEIFYYPFICLPKEGVQSKIVYILYAFMCFFPAVNEIKENLKWKYLISKI